MQQGQLGPFRMSSLSRKIMTVRLTATIPSLLPSFKPHRVIQWKPKCESPWFRPLP